MLNHDALDSGIYSALGSNFSSSILFCKFTTYANKALDKYLSQNTKYVGIMKAIRNHVGGDARDLFRRRQRKALGDEDIFARYMGFGDTEEPTFLENLYSFVKYDIPTMWAGGSEAAAETKIINDQVINLQKRIDEEKLDPNAEYIPESNAMIEKRTQGDRDYEGDAYRYITPEEGKPITNQQVLDYMKTKVDKSDKFIIDNLEELEDLNWKSQWINMPQVFDKEWNFTANFADFKGILGKQILQLPLAYFTGGLSAAAQEFGHNYPAQLEEIARKEFNVPEGEEVTNDQKLRIIKEGKDQKEIALIASAAAGWLEKFGASKAIGSLLFGKKAVGSFLRGQFKDAAKRGVGTLASAGQTGLYEAGTEIGQTAISQGLVSRVAEKNLFDFHEIVESGAQGFAAGGFFPIGGAAARQSMLEYRTTAALISAKYGNDAYGEELYRDMEGGVNQRYEEENSAEWISKNPDKTPMTEQERREKILAIGQVRNANNKIPSSMTNVEDKKEAIELLVRKKELQEKNKDKAPELITQEDKNEMKKLNIELTLLAAKQGTREITIEDQNRMVEMVNALGNIEANAYETAEEAQAAWDAVVDKYASENRIGGINLDNLNEKERALKIQEIKDGFKGVNANILYLKDGGEVIVLNNEQMGKGYIRDAVAANHEVLHSVLRRAIGEDQKAFEQIYNVLDKYLKENLSNDVYAALSLRFADKKTAGEFDEYLTTIGELMRTGTIKYNKSFIEVAQSLGTMIANFFRNLFGKPIPPSFNLKNKETGEYDAKKVFNFLKSYQRAYNAGGEQAQIFADEINAIKLEEQEKTQSVRKSESTLYENVEEIYDQYEDKATAGFMIGELYKKEIESRIDNGFIYNRNLYQPTRWDGWNEQIRQDVIVDMQFGTRGIKNLVETYDKIANPGVTLPAYINTYFNVRLFEALPNNLVGANVSIENLKDSDQLTAEETTIESDDKVRVLKSFSDFNLLSDTVVKDVKDKVIKIIQDLYTDNQNISPEFIFETIEKLISSEVRNIFNTNRCIYILIRS